MIRRGEFGFTMGLSMAIQLVMVAASVAQPPGGDRPAGARGGFPGGPMAQERKLVKKFDTDGDKRLNADERAAARHAMREEDDDRPRRGPFGLPRGMDEDEAPTPGPRIAVEDVRKHPDAGLYDPAVLRTLFLTFENDEWEQELAAFHNTDVEVPATLTVDGKVLPEVGVRFRGASSYFMVGEGHKRSLNLSIDFARPKQRLYGYKTLNLLNAHGDPSMMSTVLYSQLARRHIPAPKANFVRLVINGESWGIYPNVQQFNAEFLEENYHTRDGARWKVSGSPMARGGLEYIGDDIDDYRTRFEIKSKDNEKDWNALIALCRVLNETPPDKLEAALKPILNIDGALWFLALDNALINNDGYWTRASDYSLFRDPAGLFHLVPHDMNEAFANAMGGPGFGPGVRMPGGGPGAFPFGPPDGAQRGRTSRLPDDSPSRRDADNDDSPRTRTDGERPRARRETPPEAPPPDDRTQGRGPRRGRMGGRSIGTALDPLIGMDDASKPLRSKLLAVPALRDRYLQHVRTIAAESLSWKELGPIVAQYRKLLDKEVKADTRKLTSYDAFKRATSNDQPAEPADSSRRRPTLREFADQRSRYLLDYKPKTPDASKREAADRQRDQKKQPIL